MFESLPNGDAIFMKVESSKHWQAILNFCSVDRKYLLLLHLRYVIVRLMVG